MLCFPNLVVALTLSIDSAHLSVETGEHEDIIDNQVYDMAKAKEK